MSGTLVHLVVADKLYDMLGSGIIKSFPLFVGGNLAPDAVHARQNYQRIDKKRSHLCEGIRSYGYGYPEISKLFRERVNEFIKDYYLPANTDKDLYLGYVTHLLLDEFDMFSAYESLENKLKNEENDISASKSKRNLADEGNSGIHREFFKSYTNFYNVSASQYIFTQNVVEALEAVWDYEIDKYVSAYEINASKRWVINKYFRTELPKDKISATKSEKDIFFVDKAAISIFKQIQNMI